MNGCESLPDDWYMDWYRVYFLSISVHAHLCMEAASSSDSVYCFCCILHLRSPVPSVITHSVDICHLPGDEHRYLPRAPPSTLRIQSLCFDSRRASPSAVPFSQAYIAVVSDYFSFASILAIHKSKFLCASKHRGVYLLRGVSSINLSALVPMCCR